MPVYFLRHGESEANVKGHFAGQKDDAPLSSLGIEQARQAARELKDLGITRIISSKLVRARQTAVQVATTINFDVDKIEFDDRILEYDMGTLTGTPIRKISSEELTSAEGAEDVSAFIERVLSFLREYKNNPETILMVSHAGVGRAIEAAKQNLEPNKLYYLSAYPNAHAVELDLSWLV